MNTNAYWMKKTAEERRIRWQTLEVQWARQQAAMRARQIGPALSGFEGAELLELRKEFGYCHVARRELAAAGTGG